MIWDAGGEAAPERGDRRPRRGPGAAVAAGGSGHGPRPGAGGAGGGWRQQRRHPSAGLPGRGRGAARWPRPRRPAGHRRGSTAQRPGCCCSMGTYACLLDGPSPWLPPSLPGRRTPGLSGCASTQTIPPCAWWNWRWPSAAAGASFPTGTRGCCWRAGSTMPPAASPRCR